MSDHDPLWPLLLWISLGIVLVLAIILLIQHLDSILDTLPV